MAESGSFARTRDSCDILRIAYSLTEGMLEPLNAYNAHGASQIDHIRRRGVRLAFECKRAATVIRELRRWQTTQIPFGL